MNDSLLRVQIGQREFRAALPSCKVLASAVSIVVLYSYSIYSASLLLSRLENHHRNE